MFGRKQLDAQAEVVLREQIKESKRAIDGINMVMSTTYRYVLEVRPADATPWRAPAEHKFKNYEMARPDVGDTVPVRYAEKNPQDVEFHFDGDPRWDQKLREKAEKERLKTERADHEQHGDDAFEAALNQPPDV